MVLPCEDFVGCELLPVEIRLICSDKLCFDLTLDQAALFCLFENWTIGIRFHGLFFQSHIKSMVACKHARHTCLWRIPFPQYIPWCIMSTGNAVNSTKKLLLEQISYDLWKMHGKDTINYDCNNAMPCNAMVQRTSSMPYHDHTIVVTFHSHIKSIAHKYLL